MGLGSKHVTAVFKIADKAKSDLSKSIAIPEDEMLASYITENKVNKLLDL